MNDILDSESYNKIVSYFRKGLRKSVIQFFEEKGIETYQKVLIIEQVMKDLGAAWEEHLIPLTSLYVASRITEDVAATLFEDTHSPHKKNGQIVIGTVSEDYHSLGKNIIKRFLMPFFDVHDLGSDVPVLDFIDKASEVDADIIAVSALMLNSVEYIHEIRKMIDEKEWKRKPILLVGGAPFAIDPDLANIVGADASVKSALSVVDLCMKLVGGVKDE